MEKITYISFPGLGIKEFGVRNSAFTVFGRPIMWYGIIIVIGIIVAYFYVRYRGRKHEELVDDDIIDFCMAGVISGIIGARIWYVATSFESFKADTFGKTLYNCIAIWEGGLGFYGGLILGFISLVVLCAIKKKNFFRVADCFSLGVLIAQIFGRWGNFINGEAHGGETKLPWRMGLREEYSDTTVYVHPTFLYESLWNLLGFLIINATYKHKKFNGQIALRYLAWYGFGRMFIEGLRTDSLYIGKFRISQLFGFLCFFVCSALLVAFDMVHAVNAKKAKAAATAAGTEEEKTGEETTGASGPDESPAGETAQEVPAEQGFDIASLHGGDGEDGDADGTAD